MIPVPKNLKRSISARTDQKPTREMYNTFEEATSSSRIRNEKDDCDLYGELLAKKLRRLGEEEREELMLEIDTMLLKKRKEYNNN